MGTPPLLLRGDHRHPRHRGASDQRGKRVGLFDFESSASLSTRILQAWDCEVYASPLFAPRKSALVALRGTRHLSLGFANLNIGSQQFKRSDIHSDSGADYNAMKPRNTTRVGNNCCLHDVKQHY